MSDFDIKSFINKIVSKTLLLILFILIVLTITYPFINCLDKPLKRGDYLHNVWILAFNSQVMYKNPLKVFDTNIFHPVPGAKPFHEIQFANSIVYSFFYSLTDDPILSFNLFILFSMVLTAYSLFLLLKELTNNSIVSLFSSLIFIFHSFYIS